ncbi:inverse autotransporter beta domain-containing protein [Xenorhabdus ehlersii]|uniref:Adhesin/invasin n=1 Tax=Xenorhabdus ehlersii TaxID=290111 RepID=A0A2D0IS35_9GAMM|nr:inverse autotransporter beta domain-containing protein [Xenorhabdus ehlersii]PHM24659.1 putative invasin [Xenorhabdus ehlersii]RKE91297.1 adhesin/invasin [Xenorhabdus ehlersii]
MLPYIVNIIRFFVFMCFSLLSLSSMSAGSDHNIKTEEKYLQNTEQKNNTDFRIKKSSKKLLNSNNKREDNLNKNNDASINNNLNSINQSIQIAGNILSSSPSELAEQAKSYALNKFNSTVSSGAQKWLSQFGTARISFGLDRKGTLKNNSFDLLLPLYDNKVDWLSFSQLGYRNKDNRDTINLGLGGRYFYQNWMYGLNTFYDYDLTGKNQRLGLGGEIWGDYIKLSANTYYRLSNWQNSRNFVGYYERPANGYDINGEFFLPAYPNLGAKLTYEQYFGDKVTLFNRDTKQKKPNLVKLGLTYTPVPLFTLGVDYKQGGSRHSETQFLANFNYKLGVPLSMQLSSENVAVARTLAGSRYDLVERNNHIVLEHQKKPIAQLSLPETIIGYSQEQLDITVKLSSNAFVKQIHWTTNKDFEQHGGKLSSRVGHTIKVTLPTYLSGDSQNNNYPIYALAELEDGQKSAPVAMRVIVRPFMLKKQEGAYFTPAGPLPATGDKKDGYTFNPVITFDTVNGAPIKNATINQVQWITEPKIGSDTGVQFIDWETSDSVTLDENGYFKRKPVLVSSQPHKDVKVYLQLDSQPPQLVGEVSFDENPASFHVDKVEVLPSVPSLIANGSQAYTYSAVVLDGDNNPVRNQKIANVNWSKDKNQNGLIWNPLNGEVKTDEEGKLTTTLASIVAIEDIMVSLTIGSHKPVPAEQAVSFTTDTSKYHIHHSIVSVEPTNSLSADGQQYYTYKAVIVDRQENPVRNQKIANVKWSITQNGQSENHNNHLIFKDKEDTTNENGELTAKLSSTKAIQNVLVLLSIEDLNPVPAQRPVTFTEDTKDYRINGDIQVNPSKILTADDHQKYTYTATIVGIDGSPVFKKSIPNAIWKIDYPANTDGLKLDQSDMTTNDKGQLTAHLTSTKVLKGVIVSLTVGNQKPIQAKRAVDFKSEQMSIIVTPSSPILVGNNYTLTVNVKDATGNNPETNKKVNWAIKAPDQTAVTFTSTTSTTDGSGNASITLTSIQAQTVTVETSAEGVETTKSVDVEFKRPTIQKIEIKQPNGTILPGGEYDFAATISGTEVDDIDKYKGKFEWMLKSSTGKGLSLSPQGEVNITPNNGGILTAKLTSQKDQPVVADAVVCLTIVGAPASELPKCADPVNFKIELEISYVEIWGVNRAGQKEGFDPNKPLSGDGKSVYQYRALIVEKGSKKPILNYPFSHITWVRDHTDVTNAEVPPLEWDKEGKTDENGYLYATLKSNVGVDDVEVMLNMVGANGSKLSQSANNKVSFKVVPELAALKVYKYDTKTKTVDKSVSKLFTEQERPYNIFRQLVAELKSVKGEELVEPGDAAGYSLQQDGGGWPAISVDEQTGLVTFDSLGRGKVILDITKRNGTKRQYTYAFFPKMMLVSISNSNPISYPLDDDNNCEQEINNNGQHNQSPLYSELISTGTGTTLSDEFPDAYKFGILEGFINIDKTPYIKMLKSRQGSGIYLAYDTVTGKEIPNDDPNQSIDAYVLCALYYN